VGRANAEPAVDDEVAAESAPRSSAAAGSAPPNRLVVLVGLPGAGKSTFAAALAAAGWQVASQDELGKDATEEAVAAAIKAGKRLVVDRCNVTASERRRLLEMRPVRPAAVHFTTAVEECVERVACRTDHPTIPYGCGRPAITSMARDIEPPLASEGFAAVHTVGGADEVNALLLRWGAAEAKCSPEGRIFKFPRTRHVLNTGGSAVTRDDLVMSSDDAVRFFDGRSVVVVEEKVDGANLGFSLSAEYQIGVQNRSHWVAAASHPQFSSLDGWLDEHGWALCQLLVPEVEVLFGEWVAARHSVAYTRLPGHFIAFDIYDKRTRRFVSAAERDRRLAGLGIPVVRSLARRPFSSAADLLTLLEEGSAYGDGFVEGAYLRIDEEFGGGAADAAPVNLRRGKIVRPDFIQGCAEHWTKGGLVRNGVRPDLWAEAEAEP
jgi:atypical dual specificity phosphatase